jgi:hypothetical protein
MAQHANEGIVLGAIMVDVGPRKQGGSQIWAEAFGYVSNSKACAMFKADFKHILADWWLLYGNISAAGVWNDSVLSEFGVELIDRVGDPDE